MTRKTGRRCSRPHRRSSIAVAATSPPRRRSRYMFHAALPGRPPKELFSIDLDDAESRLALALAIYDSEGDVDTFITYETDRRSSHGAAAIASRLLAAGRAEEALVCLEQGAPTEPASFETPSRMSGSSRWKERAPATGSRPGSKHSSPPTARTRPNSSVGRGSKPASMLPTCAPTSRPCPISRTSWRNGRRSIMPSVSGTSPSP